MLKEILEIAITALPGWAILALEFLDRLRRRKLLRREPPSPSFFNSAHYGEHQHPLRAVGTLILNACRRSRLSITANVRHPTRRIAALSKTRCPSTLTPGIYRATQSPPFYRLKSGRLTLRKPASSMRATGRLPCEPSGTIPRSSS